MDFPWQYSPSAQRWAFEFAKSEQDFQPSKKKGNSELETIITLNDEHITHWLVNELVIIIDINIIQQGML